MINFLHSLKNFFNTYNYFDTQKKIILLQIVKGISLSGLPWWLRWLKKKKKSANKGEAVSTPGWEGPWRRKRQPTPVFSPGKSHGQRSLAGCSPRGHRVRHDFHFPYLRAQSSSAESDDYLTIPCGSLSGTAPSSHLE